MTSPPPLLFLIAVILIHSISSFTYFPKYYSLSALPHRPHPTRFLPPPSSSLSCTSSDFVQCKITVTDHTSGKYYVAQAKNEATNFRKLTGKLSDSPGR